MSGGVDYGDIGDGGRGKRAALVMQSKCKGFWDTGYCEKSRDGEIVDHGRCSGWPQLNLPSRTLDLVASLNEARLWGDYLHCNTCRDAIILAPELKLHNELDISIS